MPAAYSVDSAWQYDRARGAKICNFSKNQFCREPSARFTPVSQLFSTSTLRLISISSLGDRYIPPMASPAKTKKAAKGKTGVVNAAAAALSKAADAANKAVVHAADDKPKPDYDPPARPALKTKFPAGSSPVTSEQVLKASHALLKFVETQSASAAPKKPNLLDDEAGETGSYGIYSSEPVWLVVTTKKNIADKKELKPKAVKIPYPLLNPETTSALLLVKDPQRAYKDILLPSSPTVRKVLGLAKLRTKFKTYETLRQLRDTHDLILADERIIPSLRAALGSSFLRTSTKVPIPVRIATKSGKPTSQEVIDKEVKKAVEATYIHLGHTNSTNVRVGLVKHSAEKLVENVLAVIEYMITKKKCVKAGWNGVRGVYIKSGQSTALPLYLAPRIYDEDKDVITAEQRKEEKEASAEKKKANEERRKAKKVKKMAAKKGISMAAGASETNGTSGVKAAEPAQKKRKADAEDKNEEAAKEVEGTSKAKKQKIVTVAQVKKPAAKEKTEATPTTKAETPTQKRKADAEDKNEEAAKEVEGTPKAKKQKIATVAQVKKPAAKEKTEATPTTKVETPTQKRKESKPETAAAPAPAVEEKKEDVIPNVSKAKAAKTSRKAAKEAKTQEAEVVEEKAVEERKKEEAKQAEKPTAKATGKKGRAAKADKPEEEKVEEKKEEPKRRSKRVSTGSKA